MVHINLLPDARKEKLRDQNNRQLAISAATAAVIGSIGVIVLLIVITQAQSLQIRLLSDSITKKAQQITQDIPEAQAIATVQSHLDSLGTLYAGQVRVSKFFTVLESVSNNDVSISSVSLDAGNKLTVTGVARSYNSAAKLAEAMKASNVTLGENASASNQPDFSNVLLTTLSGEQGKVGLSITATVATGVTNGK
jgi:Tfp pilus assembly protein PilN